MKPTSPKIAIATLIVPAFLLTAPMAFASESHGNVTTDIKDTIQASLTEQGYEVRRVVREHGMYEAYAVKDGKLMEIYLDNDMNVVRIKQRN